MPPARLSMPGLSSRTSSVSTPATVTVTVAVSPPVMV
jgi:hypothetical protein